MSVTVTVTVTVVPFSRLYSVKQFYVLHFNNPFTRKKYMHIYTHTHTHECELQLGEDHNCAMKMAGETQHFVMTFLLLSLLFSFNTVSASRAAIMIHRRPDFPPSQPARQKKQPPLQKLLNGRMDLQYNDYPISEANPRHTPKPLGRV